MAVKRRWSDLSPRTRKLLIAAGITEGTLKAAALIDIKRRPASEIRGSKWIWIPVVILVNSAGVVPLSYFIFGRHKPSGPSAG
jgi:Phospholipase_D-nuclease N-terminal